MQNTTATLRHGQVIRVAGFSQYANRITVGTTRGYVGGTYGPEAGERAHKRAITNGFDTAWTNQEHSELNFRHGEFEDAAVINDDIAAAPVLHEGQQVEIEGETFTVRVSDEMFSDPVSFERIA